MRKLNLKKLTAALAVAFSVALPAAAQDASGPILFTNVNVFDGVNEALIKNANVVVTDNLITAVSTQPLAVAGGRVIDGGGRTLMPGLIDAHVHLSLNMGFITMYNQLPDYYDEVGSYDLPRPKGGWTSRGRQYPRATVTSRFSLCPRARPTSSRPPSSCSCTPSTPPPNGSGSPAHTSSPTGR